MKTFQLCGPFAAGSTKQIKLSSVYRILQIGIERPLSVPITVYQNFYDNSNAAIGTIPPTISINGTPFVINENDILEYDGIYQNVINLTFHSPVDKYTIIDLIFKDVDE